MDRSGWKVLIVEDDGDIRQLMALLIRRLWQCQVVEVADGLDAVALAQATHFDLMILDLVLPSMDGVEVLNRLKSDARTADIPVVVVSEHCWDQTRCVAPRAAGALDCIDKAVLFKSFAETMKRLLSSPS